MRMVFFFVWCALHYCIHTHYLLYVAFKPYKFIRSQNCWTFVLRRDQNVIFYWQVEIINLFFFFYFFNADWFNKLTGRRQMQWVYLKNICTDWDKCSWCECVSVLQRWNILCNHNYEQSTRKLVKIIENSFGILNIL